MSKIYLFFTMLFCVAFAWWSGQKYATERCNKNIATLNANQQLKIFKIAEKVNEKTDNNNTNDIRRVLCQKYSIAE